MEAEDAKEMQELLERAKQNEHHVVKIQAAFKGKLARGKFPGRKKKVSNS